MTNAVLEKESQEIKVKETEIQKSELSTLDKIIGKEKKDKLFETIIDVIPKEKIDDVAFKILNEVYKANSESRITKKYSIHYSSNDERLVRIAETWINGRRDYEKTALEKYNPESDIWEEYEKESLTPKQIEDKLSNVEFKLYDASSQLQAVSEMSLKILYSGNDKDFNGIPVLELIKERSKYIEDLTEEINCLRNHIK